MTDTIKPVAWMAPDESLRIDEGQHEPPFSDWTPLFTRAAIDAAVAQERQECIDIVARHGGSIEIEAAIRARAALGEKT